MRIHQVLVGAGAGDAITSMARTLQRGLRTIGDSEIYAHFLGSDVAGQVLPLHTLPFGDADDVLVYHASFGSPDVTRVLLDRPERLVVVYHNITPSEHFVRVDPQFALGLEWGKHELRLLRDRVRLSVAVSEFNAADLRELGFDDVHVIPAGLHPSRLTGLDPDPHLADDLAHRFPGGYVLAVSQVLPHKRFHTVIEAMHLVQWVHELQLGLVVVGTPRLPSYLAALHRHAERLNVHRLWFAGGATDRTLATAFRLADSYVTVSAHEGLAIPPLEAMSFGVPVIARSAGALAETIGGGGLVLPPEAGPVLVSEAINEVHMNQDLRSRLRCAGRERVAEIERTDASGRFVELLLGEVV
jgi:glycosyltransferase involved in cell wall biosynthesis